MLTEIAIQLFAFFNGNLYTGAHRKIHSYTHTLNEKQKSNMNDKRNKATFK